MTISKIALAALVVVSSAFAAPAFAQSDSDSASDERKCAFVAEAGGYVCEDIKGGDSLSEGGEGSGLIIVIAMPYVL